MKECEKYAALLDAFSEGDLFLEDMIQVQNHLMNCPDCQAYLEDLMVMREAFPTVEDTEGPEGFADRVMAAVAEHPRAAAPAPAPKAKKTPWRKVLLPIAACCAVVILLGRTAISGGSSAPAAKFSAQTEAAVVTEETVEETVAEAAMESQDAAESPAAFTVTTSTTEAAPAEPEACREEDYTYTAKEDFKEEPKAKEPAEDGANAPAGGLTADTAAPEEAEPPILRDGSEFVLTAAEASNLLEDFTPDAETETEALYLLSAHEYTGLLMALPKETRQSAPANAAETMRVIVVK